MSDEIKEIYLSNLEWTKTHDNMGGVIGNVVFKDNMSYVEYNKLFKSGYFILCDKDYITNLQEELEEEKRIEQADFKTIQNLEEENQRLKEALCKDNIVPKCKYDYIKRQKEGLELALSCIKDYKSRCEKAIECIEDLWRDTENTHFFRIIGVGLLRAELLNILNGDKDE